MANPINEKLSPILDDQPASKDLLDFESYVEALRDLIIHNKTQTPLTLGIFGRWGMGKTTLMKMLENSLNKEGILTIWFNAWQYNDEDKLWAAFLQSMLNKIQHSLGAFQLPWFKIKLFIKRIQWNQVPQSLLAYLFRVLIAILPILLVDPVSQQFTPDARYLIGLGGGITALALSIWIVGKPLFDSVQQNVSINIKEIQKASNYQEHIAFLDQFREHFSDIVQSLPAKGNKRLTVFIDDLDRCSPERTIQVLDAIKLFVDVHGCIYVLGLDVDVAQKAVATKYKDDLIAQQEYMNKIIQLPFQLPPLTRENLEEFLGQLSVDLPDPNCQNVFITGLTVNPREIKRTINIFSLLWNLATKRAELVGKISPVRLAKVIVIQQGYSELHKMLLQRPRFLVDLECLIRQENADKSDVNPKQGNIENKKIDLPPEVSRFSQIEALRNMLLLHDLPEPDDNIDQDQYNFAYLNPEDVAVYFTLTSRPEAPVSVEVEEFRKSIAASEKESLVEKIDLLRQMGDYYRHTLPSQIDLDYISETEAFLDSQYRKATTDESLSSDIRELLKKALATTSSITYAFKSNNVGAETFSRIKELGEILLIINRNLSTTQIK